MSVNKQWSVLFPESMRARIDMDRLEFGLSRSGYVNMILAQHYRVRIKRQRRSEKANG